METLSHRIEGIVVIYATVRELSVHARIDLPGLAVPIVSLLQNNRRIEKLLFSTQTSSSLQKLHLKYYSWFGRGRSDEEQKAFWMSLINNIVPELVPQLNNISRKALRFGQFTSSFSSSRAPASPTEAVDSTTSSEQFEHYEILIEN